MAFNMFRTRSTMGLRENRSGGFHRERERSHPRLDEKTETQRRSDSDESS